jgi:uncharacterized protein YhhL (DUF1145 family)
MLTTNRVAGAALALLALVVAWESRRLPFGSLRAPGPAFAPVALACLLLVFGVLLVLFAGKSPSVGTLHWTEGRHALAIFGVCAFAALALERVGFRPTVALSLAFLLGVVERRNPIFTAVFALGLAVGMFLLFETILRVPLPRGPFGI